MPDDLTQFSGLLDDPIEEPEHVEEVDPIDSEPLLPDQDSDGNDVPAEPDDSDQPAKEEEDNVLISYLKSRGIEDPKKIQFENDEGGIEEVDFDTLSKEEQLTMLQELSASDYSDYEKEVINFLRQNGGDLKAIVEAYQNQAIEDYLAQNPDAVHQKSYKIDDYSDDELYIADLAARFQDLTEDELNSKLESAKLNEDLFKKEVDALRAFYKGEEDRQEEAAKKQEEQEYQNLQNTLLDAVGKFNEIVLDDTDPQSDSLEIEDSDKQIMLNYLLAADKDGQSQFDKDLSDPKALIELAWLRTHGRETITGISQYWKKELADTRKELTKVKNELEKYKNKEDRTNVTVKPRPTNNSKAKTIVDIWDV